MTMTKLERLMFLQGQRCFFCDHAIPKSEASVEHLVPSSSGGADHTDNLVACCKALNGLFGSMTVKEKIRAILNQNDRFVCPSRQIQPQSNEKPATSVVKSAAEKKAPANQGKPWTPDEERQLLESFDAQVSILDIAKALNRGVGGIQARLTKLGRLSADQYKTYPPESV